MILSVTAQKGGVAKTTTAAVLAQAAAYMGKRVLCVDMDSQYNLSQCMGADFEFPGNSYNLLKGYRPEEQIHESSCGVDLIAGVPELSAVRSDKGTAGRLGAALEKLRGLYDVIMIDPPAAEGELQYNALRASDAFILPLMVDSYSVQALYQTIETAADIGGIRCAGVVITRYKSTTNLSKQFRSAIEDLTKEADIPFLGVVREGVAVQEAASLHASLYSKGKWRRSAPAVDYMDIAQKLFSEER